MVNSKIVTPYPEAEAICYTICYVHPKSRYMRRYNVKISRKKNQRDKMPFLYITFSQCSLRSPHFACRTGLTSFLIQHNSNSLSTVVLREYTCSCNNYKRFPLFCATSLLKIILISIGINFLVFKLQHFRRLVSTVNINNDININVVSYYHIIITNLASF